VIQAQALLSYTAPPEKIQNIVVEALEVLNNSSELISPTLVGRSVRVASTYEIGVAEGDAFNFLTDSEAKRLKRWLRKRPTKALDFLMCIFYRHIKERDQETSLWSDFQCVRFSFEERDTLQIRVHHFKGTRKIPLDILIEKIVKKINERAKIRRLGPVKLTRIRGH